MNPQEANLNVFLAYLHPWRSVVALSPDPIFTGLKLEVDCRVLMQSLKVTVSEALVAQIHWHLNDESLGST